MSNNEEFENISFDLPKNQSNVIKVIGVGGGGSNAINHMFQQGIKGVDFVICNTDAQALENSSIPNKIQLGVSLTEGLGAGANPEVGEQSAVESYEEIKRMLDTNTKMIFITAGMGGGTGTGAAPIIAKMAKELDILTVGIVTIPFQFEGRMRNEQAQLGVEKLRAHVDSLVVINNNKLREVYGNLGFKAGFSKADEVLATASRGIAEVITHHYTQNIDLRDAKTVLSNSGTAIMGSANASGNKRAHDAIVKALDSPLLNDNKITGAKNVLLLIVSGKEEITIDEIGEINDHIQQEAGHGANIIMGVGEDESLEDSISVTVIATGFDVEQQDEIVNTETKKIIHTLEDEQRTAVQDLSPKSTGTRTSLPIVEEVKKEKIIKHELVDEDEIEQDTGLIPTTNLLKNIDVSYEVVDPFSVDNDFVIINAQDIIKQIEVNDEKEISKEQEKKDQFALAFDMPVEENKEEIEKEISSFKENPTEKIEEERAIVFDLSDDILDLEVKDPIEVIPLGEKVEGGGRKYSLEDYMEEEKRLTEAKPVKVIEEDKEILLEKKTIAPSPKTESTEDVDPIDQPISETLKARAAERRAKMKEFNYKFRNSSSIEDIEKEPAYKRAGIDVDSRPNDSGLSRTSLGVDGNDDIQLRKNNSFLHDNVD
ncbi:cell division protein FtsZ [Aquimarina muelleri]|uniref:Cell division protein FtsZ n=1 Tax=Aquimarina muelleri TaxID=279356 RepID=A0A918JT10_9FLAO|nr:cell division protein FtsZ [Aquimarina muelleri]MCX2763126.1 cell division protein FtsZ [Aquimarina muelleri]GGX06453.1 cell division protein FtsZ [Aquimarina muelleri]